MKNRLRVHFLSFLFLLICLSARASLPPNWTSEDFGSPAKPGLADDLNGLWTITGGGADIWSTADQFQLTHTNLSGDGVVIAQVLQQTSVNSFAQSGVMLRNDNSAGSAEASVSITPSSGVTFRYRLSAGATTAQTLVSGVTAPVWVRLIRSGNSFSAYYSGDSTSWIPIGSPRTITMNSLALAGFCVTAHDNTRTNTASFTNLTIKAGAPPPSQVPPDLTQKFLYQTNWPLPQLDVSNNAPTPRMGWNSWFVVGDGVGPSETLIRQTVDALVTNHLAAFGYKILTIDATWIAVGRGFRDGAGNLIVDSNRWPSGMKAVSDYVHSKGLLMGGYSDIGATGWGSPAQIGMNGYYQQDANQFAAWEWDFIKIDDHGPGDFFSAAYAIVNNASNRPITLSLSTPQTDGMKFATRIANSFRVHNDISFSFGSVSWENILVQFDTAQNDWFTQAPGHWLDPDMLCVGFNGISDLEGRSHFNLWCILGAPLIIGTDVRTSGGAFPPPLSGATLATLTNSEVIATDQDTLGAVGRPVAPDVYVKPLGSFTSGQYAVLLLNRSGVPKTMTVNWSDVGLVPGSSATVRDLWAHADLGSFSGSYVALNIPSHGSVMLKITGAFDWSRPRTYEAESAYNTLGGLAYYTSNNAFSSGAYVTNVGGASNTLQFNKIAAPSNALYQVDIYYACASNRTADVLLNGAWFTNFTFAATGGDLQPASTTLYLNLVAGENTLTFSNANSAAPDFDKLVVSQGTPSAFAVTAGDTRVDLSWNAVNGAASYNIYRGTTSGGETLLTSGITTNHFTDTTVANGVMYYYAVSAIVPALGGESPPSVEAKAMPRYATSSSAYVNAVLGVAPLAYWRLNESSGTTAFDSVGGFHGTYLSAVTLGAAGPRPPDFLGFELSNTAVLLSNNLNNSWLTIPALNLNTNTATFTAWIYPVGSQAAYAGLIFCRGSGTVAGMNFNSGGTDLGYTWNDAAGSWGWNSGVTPPANQWSFVAAVITPTNAIVYMYTVDGLQTATNTLSHPTQAFSVSGTIGTDTFSSAARTFNGLVDEVAVFNRSLTAAQLEQLYDNGHQLPQEQIAVQISGGNLNLAWPQGTLLQATNIFGPWSVVTNGTSPFSVPPTNDSMFFRALLR